MLLLQIKTWIRSFYEGAKVTKANRNFGQPNATFEDNAQNDRTVLRTRARWLSANNPIMSNIDNSILNNVVGQGLKVRFNSSNDDFNIEANLKFNAWAKNKNKSDWYNKINFYDMQRLILQTRMIDGEIFIYKKVSKDGLQLQLIEADNLNPLNNGIIKNTEGIITHYDIISNNKSVLVPVADIINYYKVERSSQDRGVSEYKQSILDIKNFSAFQSSTIIGARARSSIAYTVKSDLAPNKAGANDTTDGRIQELNGVLVYYLKKGESIDKQAPSGGGEDYKPFVQTTVRMIATGRKVSYELAYKDYSQVNFASSRASLIQDNKTFDGEQTHLTSYVLDEIVNLWLEVELMRNGFNSLSYSQYLQNVDDYENKAYIPPKREWVDPLKDMLAVEKEISLNITSESEVAESLGKDYKGILKRKAEEIKMKTELGLPIVVDGVNINEQLMDEILKGSKDD